MGTITLTHAQKGWEAGGWIGTSYYFGDLNTNYDLSMPGLAGGGLVRYNFNNRLCLKLSANYGKIMADDANSSNPFEKARNLSFESTLIDGAVQLEFNFLPYIHGSKDEFFTPYVFAGFNVFHFNPKASYQGEMVELRPLGTEGQFKGEEYYSVSGGLAYGLGIKVDLSYEISLNFELSARSLFTDYLDDVSTVYPDKKDLLKLRNQTAVDLSDRSIELPGIEDSQIGQKGTQRGNSSNNDSFVMLGVGLVYYFGDIRCPEYGRRK
ncbi:MAG: outer membrane beta-barrel protein [Phaeodactylibacter sp.]|nr:outer membrane beta-barrel protein [Phaeodactylibacter sp.]MCB9050933.1 outer membrane beta-barrel protein [Lewinellaceae bacterium]